MRRTPEKWAPGFDNSPTDTASTSTEPPGRSLNVHFNFNGHSWDAYEALGLPAGSSQDKVEAAYQKAILSTSENSKEFYDHARQAILNKK